MRLTLIQPPYPSQATIQAAQACVDWMIARLDELEPGEHDLVLLPEYANAPGLADATSLQSFAADQGQALLQAVQRAAGRLRCPIATGAVTRQGQRWCNQAHLYDGQGRLVAAHDKVHLTQAERELGLRPGGAPTVLEHQGLRIAFAICLDLYFPEYFMALAQQQVDLVLCPSYQRSESAQRIALIAQARALDTGCHLARASYAMGTPGVGGHSLLAAPTGELLADAGQQPGVLATTFDPQAKLVKPASHGQAPVEHMAMTLPLRMPSHYPPAVGRAAALQRTPFPHLCAHRGLSLACPENTLPAFAAAIAAGAHEIELDVRYTRDGVPVICHDATVDRTTDGHGPIADHDWESLSKLDAGVKLGEPWRGTRIPRLEEILDLADGRVGLNIHFYGADQSDDYIRQGCDLLMERGLTDIAYLALGNEAALQIARSYAPQVPLACLVHQSEPSRMIELALKHGCSRVQFFRNATAQDIASAKAAGLICNLFYADLAQEGWQYVQAGIDVVLTNCTHQMVADGFPRRID